VRKVLVTAMVCFAATAAHADFTKRGSFSADIHKILIDDRAWFYLRVCSNENGGDGDLRALLDRYAAMIYRDGDDSDGAAEWRTRYRDDYGDPEISADCDSVREFLRGTIYAPAIRPKAKP
jgi:hypothetical protein